MAAQNENALPNGTVLKHGGNEYRIERYLGAGGFGITYLVSGTANVSGNTVTSKYCVKEHFLSSDCERDHQTLRVTCFKPARERVSDGKKDFLSEAKRLRDKIQHSHIVRVKDVFEAFDTAYYVMEFLDGKSLRNYIKKHGACEEDEAIALMLPIIRAIGYLHDQRITHLDIKPDNIMIVENERGIVSPTLIDFGLSKHYDKKGKATSSIRVMATSDGYSPVEQYQGIETFQPTADIYALAATFVYCITGEDPKKSADIRPGEIRQLLQGKVSDSSLSAVLNGMKPSQYERTQSVRDLMAELCPDEDSENWDVETDNNITDPIFFRKRNVQSSFISKIKILFAGRVKKPKLLDMPDASIVVDIKYPKGEAFSKRVYFCFDVCNTVFTYDGNEQVDDVDFFGGLNGDVRDFFMQSSLLEDKHWEYEQSISGCPGNISVGITFHYKDGHEYSRAAIGVNTSNKLYQVLHGLLNCKSIKGIVFEYDDTHEPNKQLHIKTESIFLESTMLAYYNGMLTSINFEQWRQLSLIEKSKFRPFIVEVVIDNQRIGMFVEERNNIAFKDVKNVLANYEKQLNPSGVAGYERGECRLLSSDEMLLLEWHLKKLQNTFDEWGIKGMSMQQWVMNSGYISSYSVITGPSATTSNMRPYVKYHGTMMVYSNNPEQSAQDEIKLVECVHCGKILKVRNSPHLTTKQIRCPECKELFQVKAGDSWQEIIKIKCPFDGAILSVKNQPGIESKNVTCPVCGYKNLFTQYIRIL